MILETVLKEMNDILAVKAQDKGLEYVCNIDPACTTLVKGDPGKVATNSR